MVKKKIKEERALSVVKQNDIVQKARYRLDLLQQKTILYLISKINSVKDVEFQEITVNVKDLCEIMGINNHSGKNIKDIKEALQKLADKSLWVEMGDVDDTIVLMRWLSEVAIKRGRGTVTVQFDKKMAPFLLQIENCFVKYQLVNVLPMKSQYSLRLYELIKSHNRQGKWEVTIEDLRKQLFIEPGQYTDWRNFSRRILATSVMEICNYTDLVVAFSTKRADRKIHSLTFEMCNIDEVHYTEGARREINRDIILDNMSSEVVPPKKMPTIKDVRDLRKKQYQAKEREKMEKMYRNAKTAGDNKEDLFMPGQLSFQEMSF